MVGDRVLMHGAEATADWHLGRNLKTVSTLGYVRGHLADRGGEPLPRLPPLQSRISLPGSPPRL